MAVAKSRLIQLILILALFTTSHAYMQSFTQICGPNMEYHTCAPICPERCNTKSDTYCLSRETLTIEGHIYSTGSEHEFSGCSSGCVCQPDYIMSDQGNFCIQAEDCDKDHGWVRVGIFQIVSYRNS